MDRSPLREHDVRLIVGAVGISALGDFLLWIPLTLRIQKMGGSGLAMAGLFLALWTPLVVLAPVAGLVVDRREARGVLLVASLAQMAVAASLVLAVDSGGRDDRPRGGSAPGSRCRRSSRSFRSSRGGSG